MDPDDFGQRGSRSGWTPPGERHDDGYDGGGGGGFVARHASHQRSEEREPPGGWNLGRGCSLMLKVTHLFGAETSYVEIFLVPTADQCSNIAKLQLWTLLAQNM